MIVVAIKNWMKSVKGNLATWFMMLALFFNPFGFDIIQYQLIQTTGTLWRANFVMYVIAGLFLGLSIFCRWFYNLSGNEKK